MFSRKNQGSLKQAILFVDELIGMGYLKFSDERYHSTIRDQLIESVQQGYIYTEIDENCVGLDRRSYPADSEELAEGNIGECIRQFLSILQMEKVPIENVVDQRSQERYEVVIDGRAFLIYDDEYVHKTLDIHHGADLWTLASLRTLEIVNLFLEEAGSKERLYFHRGGNDGYVWFLTEDMYQHYLNHLDLIIQNEQFKTSSQMREALYVPECDDK
ncbi:MAG: hypothetical protein KDA65_19500 [Planctomycetaceae bacterium]|nr:hypothetical protein [Planctomycetaceae bacterium]